MKKHIVIVGLPGAGKSTVGKLLAGRLGATLTDLDAVIVRRMQMPIARVFAEHGESKFRALEAEAMQQALAGPPGVLVPGGGWAAQPGALEAALPSALIVYLRAMATTAAKRAVQDESRPLLGEGDPVERMRELHKAREPFYRRAHREVNVEGKTPEVLADQLVLLARSDAGW